MQRGTWDAAIAVDWSAAGSPGRAGGQRDGLWAAVAADGEAAGPRPFRTRAEVTRWMVTTCARLADAGRRVILGIDLALGYPEGTARALGVPAHAPAWRWTWDLLAGAVADDEANANDRFAAAGRLNARIGGGPGPFWGHPPGHAVDDLVMTKGSFPHSTGASPHPLAEHRRTERHLRAAGLRPKSVWQLAGAGAVGSQSLVGIPRVRALRDHPSLTDRTAVWPFETGLAAPGTAVRVLLAEVYPSALGPVDHLHEVRDAAQVVATAAALAAMGADGRLDRALALPRTDPQGAGSDEVGLDRAGRRAVVAEEGWVLDVEPLT